MNQWEGHKRVTFEGATTIKLNFNYLFNCIREHQSKFHCGDRRGQES